MTRKNKTRQYQAFEGLMRDLLKVSHAQIKAKLDAQKAAKKRRPKRKEK